MFLFFELVLIVDYEATYQQIKNVIILGLKMFDTKACQYFIDINFNQKPIILKIHVSAVAAKCRQIIWQVVEWWLSVKNNLKFILHSYIERAMTSGFVRQTVFGGSL